MPSANHSPRVCSSPAATPLARRVSVANRLGFLYPLIPARLEYNRFFYSVPYVETALSYGGPGGLVDFPDSRVQSIFNARAKNRTTGLNHCRMTCSTRLQLWILYVALLLYEKLLVSYCLCITRTLGWQGQPRPRQGCSFGAGYAKAVVLALYGRAAPG
jgi:hypothetical protein